jgi:hypothetical protein
VNDMGLYPLRLGELLESNQWVEFHLHRFLTSKFKAYCLRDGDAGRAVGFTALLLWSECYRQDPAGTLPDDDVELASLAGFGADVDGWLAVRTRVLHGWQFCAVETDAEPLRRLGHPLIAEIAARSFKRKAGKTAGRTAAALAVTRTRTKAQLEKLGQVRLSTNPEAVNAIAAWLNDSGLWVTEDNVAQGVEVLTGAPCLRVVNHRKGGTFQ